MQEKANLNSASSTDRNFVNGNRFHLKSMIPSWMIAMSNRFDDIISELFKIRKMTESNAQKLDEVEALLIEVKELVDGLYDSLGRGS